MEHEAITWSEFFDGWRTTAKQKQMFDSEARYKWS